MRVLHPLAGRTDREEDVVPLDEGRRLVGDELEVPRTGIDPGGRLDRAIEHPCGPAATHPAGEPVEPCVLHARDARRVLGQRVAHEVPRTETLGPHAHGPTIRLPPRLTHSRPEADFTPEPLEGIDEAPGELADPPTYVDRAAVVVVEGRQREGRLRLAHAALHGDLTPGVEPRHEGCEPLKTEAAEDGPERPAHWRASGA